MAAAYKRLVEGTHGSDAPPITPRCAVGDHGSGGMLSKFASPPGRSPASSEPPRLFDTIASKPEPSDMSEYYSNCSGFAQVEDANAQTLFIQRMMLGICTGQVICSCGFLSLQDTTPDSIGRALMLISAVVAFVSGGIGLAGAWKKSTCVQAPRLRADRQAAAPPLSQLLRSPSSSAPPAPPLSQLLRSPLAGRHSTGSSSRSCGASASCSRSCSGGSSRTQTSRSSALKSELPAGTSTAPTAPHKHRTSTAPAPRQHP